MSAPTSRVSPERHRSRSARACAVIGSARASMRLRPKAGLIMRRWRRQKSPFEVTSPLPRKRRSCRAPKPFSGLM